MSLEQLSKATFDTPLGKMTAIASKKGLWLLTFQEEFEFIQARLSKWFAKHEFDNSHQSILKETKLWLDNYFSKNFKNLKLPILHLQGTPFAIRAWKALQQVPIGTTQSYGDLAKKLGNPQASRAIGRVMGQNPIVILLPCHRIIGSNGALTGYGGGLERKIWALEHEGLSIT